MSSGTVAPLWVPAQPRKCLQFFRHGSGSYSETRAGVRSNYACAHVCSDKIAKWMVLGWQGALLSAALDAPLRFSAVHVAAAPGGPVANSTGTSLRAAIAHPSRHAALTICTVGTAQVNAGLLRKDWRLCRADHRAQIAAAAHRALYGRLVPAVREATTCSNDAADSVLRSWKLSAPQARGPSRHLLTRIPCVSLRASSSQRGGKLRHVPLVTVQVHVWDASPLGLGHSGADADGEGSSSCNTCICWACPAQAWTATPQRLRRDNGRPVGAFEVTLGSTGQRAGAGPASDHTHTTVESYAKRALV